MNNKIKGGNLNTKQLTLACESTLKQLKVICPNRNDLLQVLMHVTAAALIGYSPQDVVAYFMKITQMLDGKFDITGHES